MLGPFLLLAELGRGNSGRTFLASDPGLADRPVVVKVIPDDRGRASGAGPACGTRISSRFSPSTRFRSGVSAGFACRSWAGRAWRASWTTLPTSLSKTAAGELLVKVIDRHTRCNALRTPSGRAVPSQPRAGLVRRGHDLDRVVPGRCASVLARARAGSHGHQAVERPDHDGRPADAPGFPPGARADPGGRARSHSPGRDAGLDVAGAGAGDDRHRGGPPGARSPSTGDPTSSRSGLLLGEALGVVAPAQDRRLAARRGPGRGCERRPASTSSRNAWPKGRRPLPGLRDPGRGPPSRAERSSAPRRAQSKPPRALAKVAATPPRPARLGCRGPLDLAGRRACASPPPWLSIEQRVGQIQLLLEDGRSDRAGGRFEDAIRALGRGLESAAPFPRPRN